MGYIQGADRNQIILLPDTLDDYVCKDDEVRAIDAFIDSLDISLMGFKADPAKEGRPGYDPRDMLKLYMYGYLNHIRSSRRLQKEASRNVEVMWLLKKVVPDFRCIADFRKDNAKSIKEVFKAFVELEVMKRREQGSSLYLDKETGELVSYAEMKAQGGLDKAPVEVRREPPLQPYFECDIEKDVVICLMEQPLFYAGPGQPNGKKDPTIRRYHRLSACLKCPNKCTLHERRIVSFKEGEIMEMIIV